MRSRCERMAIPPYHKLYVPILEFLADGQVHSVTEIRSHLVEKLQVQPEELQLMLPSRRAPLFHNRVGWATTYLRQAKAIEGVRRGLQKITERGRALIAGHPESITNESLMAFGEFREFLGRGRGPVPPITTEELIGNTTNPTETKPPGQDELLAETPDEDIERGVERQRSALTAEILATLLNVSPEFFEKVVIDILVAMGYGGSFAEAAQAVGRQGDGGIDGVIHEDRLGLESIYVQAKRWKDAVGRPIVQGFVGSLVGLRAKKGVFITTSWFSQEARDYVRQIEHRVVLIDGRQLANLMVEYDVGVSTTRVLKLKHLDSDYFEGESDVELVLLT
jgi:restriction system protein